jgi:CRISPR-associated protein Cas2
MRLLVLYDLPVDTKESKRIYARFRKFLLRDGYDMLQYSVYARICNGQDAVNVRLAVLKLNLPPEGSVRTMQVTEKQYTSMGVLVGKKTEKEKPEYAEQLTFF